MSDTLSRLQSIFRDVFDDESLALTRDASSKTIEEWDSLAQISLVSAIEKEFGIRFTVAEVQALHDVGDMVDLIERKKTG